VSVRLDKVKRPGGTFSFELSAAGADRHGTWLFGPTDALWTSPHDQGVLPFDVLVLLAPDRPWVTWWVDDPADRRVEIDVCRPPEPTDQGWRYVDLELDPIRHEDGRVEIEDEDELAEAREQGWMSADDAELAVQVAEQTAQALRDRIEPWGAEGWRRLGAARADPPT
jgi:hypothetical protein